MNITVYTVINNCKDFLRPPLRAQPGVRYVCFANLPMPSVPPWEIQPCPQLPEPRPCPEHQYFNGDCSRCRRETAIRTSRIPKLLPHLWLDSEYSIYHDGNIQMKAEPEDIVSRRLVEPDTYLALYRHPQRCCIYEEAAVCVDLARDAVNRGYDPIPEPGPIMDQMKHYRLDGHPAEWGLWCGGVIIRQHTDMMARLNEAWWQNFNEGSTRDQLAFPPALRGLGCNINSLRGSIYDNQDFVGPQKDNGNWHMEWRHKHSEQENEWYDREMSKLARLSWLCAHGERVEAA